MKGTREMRARETLWNISFTLQLDDQSLVCPWTWISNLSHFLRLQLASALPDASIAGLSI